MKRIRIFALSLFLILILFACAKEPDASTSVGASANASAPTASTSGGSNAGGSSQDIGGESSSQQPINETTVSFAQEGDITVITIISPYIPQFTEEALKLPDGEIRFANFGLNFNNQDDWEKSFSVSFGHQHTSDQEVTSHTSYGRFYQNDYQLNSDEGGLQLKVTGDKAEWFISGVELSLDGITDVQISAGLVNSISDPSDYLFLEHMPITQVVVNDTLPMPDVSELPFDITGAYIETYSDAYEGGFIFVEAVPGGYVMTCGDYVSPIFIPNEITEDELFYIIKFSTTGFDRLDFSFSMEKEDPDGGYTLKNNLYSPISAYFSIHSSDGQDQSYGGDKVYLQPGTFMTYDFTNGVSSPMVSYEMQDGKFRFRFPVDGYSEEYETDWVTPISSSGRLRFPIDIEGREAEVTLTGEVRGFYSIAVVGIEGTGWRSYLRENEALLPLLDFTGTYLTTSSSGEQFMMTIEDGEVTCTGVFEGTCTAADLFSSIWKPFGLTYDVTGEKLLAMRKFDSGLEQGTNGKFGFGDELTLEIYEDKPGGEHLGSFYMQRQ